MTRLSLIAIIMLYVTKVCVAAEPDAQVVGGGKLDAMEKMDFRAVVRAAKEKVFPAVVFIKCIRESMESGKKISEEVAGSGAIISAKGEVVTNWHVVDKAAEVRCLLLDGQAVQASVVGSDKDTDLALLQLKLPADAAKPLPFARFGQAEKLVEGDFVMACGAPWGLSRSVSIGIISCTRRYLVEHSEYSLWLQTDASISPGNSGGPLVNTAGEIVGINTRGMSSGGDMGFAVPSETVLRVVDQIRANGSVKWGWTGVRLQPLRDFNKNMYFDAKEGVIVAATDPESPAKRAGLLPKDRIVKINDQSVTAVTEEDLPSIRRQLGQLPLNKAAKLAVVRDDKTLTVELTPREKGKVEGEELDCPRWDMTVKTINQFDNEDLYYYREKGVFIFGVKSPGNASSSGLQRNDIVVKVDGKEVTTLDEVKAIHAESLKNMKAKSRIVFTILRGGLTRQVVLDISRDYEKE
ncbi:MAG: trypsin-like peptidase domain-containing protein [Phycisphaerae bacterium]|nr:trypsin-like peptidase domain-containing protein [Phycisphaerae bacterium]